MCCADPTAGTLYKTPVLCIPCSRISLQSIHVMLESAVTHTRGCTYLHATKLTPWSLQSKKLLIALYFSCILFRYKALAPPICGAHPPFSCLYFWIRLPGGFCNPCYALVTGDFGIKISRNRRLVVEFRFPSFYIGS